MKVKGANSEDIGILKSMYHDTSPKFNECPKATRIRKIYFGCFLMRFQSTGVKTSNVNGRTN